MMEKRSLLKTYSDTDAEKVKQANANSGLSYRETINRLASEFQMKRQ
ncbi:hypothetical protein [Bacillus sp. FJAT-42376]|nr:hypothetical protein [Bacillus sp. FJAT-42376]